LLTKPVSRKQIFFTKLASGISVLLFTNVIFIVCGLILFSSRNEADVSYGTFALCLFSVLFTQLIFFGFGVFYATFSKKIRSVSGTAITFGFGAFFLSALANITNDDIIKLFSPLKYFDPYTVLTKDFYEGKYVVMAVLLFTLCMILSLSKYCKSDVHTI
jgi:ABC-2 type transport system permease protein